MVIVSFFVVSVAGGSSDFLPQATNVSVVRARVRIIERVFMVGCSDKLECLDASCISRRKDSRCKAKCCEEFSHRKINRGTSPTRNPFRLTFWYIFPLRNGVRRGLYLQPANGVMAQLVSALL